jgi:hypothetical protein
MFLRTLGPLAEFLDTKHGQLLAELMYLNLEIALKSIPGMLIKIRQCIRLLCPDISTLELIK